MFVMLKKKKVYPAYVSKNNSNPEKQVILLMISNRKLSTLLGVTNSKNNGDFYCLNCLHFFRTKNKLNYIKKYVKKKRFL